MPGARKRAHDDETSGDAVREHITFSSFPERPPRHGGKKGGKKGGKGLKGHKGAVEQVDRTKAVPSLVRAWVGVDEPTPDVSQGSFREGPLSNFYCWANTTLAELTSQVQRVKEEARQSGAELRFALCSPTVGKGDAAPVFRTTELGTTRSQQHKRDDETVVGPFLATTGAYLLVLVHAPRKARSLHPEASASAPAEAADTGMDADDTAKPSEEGAKPKDQEMVGEESAAQDEKAGGASPAGQGAGDEGAERQEGGKEEEEKGEGEGGGDGEEGKPGQSSPGKQSDGGMEE